MAKLASVSGVLCVHRCAVSFQSVLVQDALDLEWITVDDVGSRLLAACDPRCLPCLPRARRERPWSPPPHVASPPAPLRARGRAAGTPERRAA